MKALFVTTEDKFFLSHRKPIADALHARGIEVVVAARETGARVGYRFVPLPLERGSLSPLQEMRTLAALVELYRREKPDVVHHSTIKANVYGSIAARLTGVKAIVNTVTGLGFALTERPHDSLKQRLVRIFAKQLYVHALYGETIFQNPDQQRAFGLPRSTLILGAGVDTVRFAPTPLPKDDLVILPARMLWDKGIAELVEAARIGGFRVALVGGEDLDNGAAIPRDTIASWTHVQWWGYRSDMPQVYAQATLVALPSYAEGLPLALAEAQACGRPVVTTDAPGCRHAIIPDVTGTLVPLRDARALAHAITTLLADRPRLERMALAARQHAVASLSQERVVRETLAVIERQL